MSNSVAAHRSFQWSWPVPASPEGISIVRWYGIVDYRFN
jgi:hypothetical protein